MFFSHIVNYRPLDSLHSCIYILHKLVEHEDLNCTFALFDAAQHYLFTVLAILTALL